MELFRLAMSISQACLDYAMARNSLTLVNSRLSCSLKLVVFYAQHSKKSFSSVFA